MAIWRESTGTKNKLRLNIGWCSNDKKPKELWRNIDRVADGVLMMRNQRNKEETKIEPTDVSQPLETKAKND